jgi:hypothetical protein
VPLTAITNSTYTDPRQRQLFKNIIYLGALCALLDLDPKLVEQLIGEQYKGKEKLLSSNVHALHLGRDWALQNLKCPIGLRVKKSDKVGDRIFIEGNSAAALGAGLWRRHGLRLVSDHAVIVGRGSLHQPLARSTATTRRPARRSTPSCRARTNSPRSAS